MKSTLKKFQIHIAEEDIQDLRRRVSLHPISVWRQREEWMNTFDHYVAEVDGTKIHFIRREAKTPGAVPPSRNTLARVG